MESKAVMGAFRSIFAEFQQQERERNQMYLEVGRAIVSLSVIEEYMAAAFVALSKPMEEKHAGVMFYESQSIPHKIKLLDYAVMKSGWAEGKKLWSPLSAQVSKQKWARNAAAHASIGFRYEKEAKKWHLKLTRQEFDSKSAIDLEIGDVKSAAIELEELSRTMRQFVVRALAYADFKLE